MKWSRGQSSDDVLDRRGAEPAAGGGSGGMGGMPLPRGKGGLIVLALVVVLALAGGGQCLGGGTGGSDGAAFDITDIFEQLPADVPAGQTSDEAAPPGGPDPEQELVDFVTFVVDDVQDGWAGAFPEGQYRRAQTVLYRQSVESGCGVAPSTVGPFYCPADEKVYLDLSFFQDLSDRFGAPGDFAIAYVIAHEIGHHVQNLTGTNQEVQRASQQDPDQANELSVRLELQADCLAGVWAQSTYERGLLEDGDLEEALTAASAVGDDTIQSQSGMQIEPDTWTHGSAEQRRRWFTRGFESGSTESCDTFNAADL
jgi:hypothetical protein